MHRCARLHFFFSLLERRIIKNAKPKPFQRLVRILTYFFSSKKPCLPVHLNSCVGKAWMGLSFKCSGVWHLGPPTVNPFVLNQSANQAMWQLQLKGLAIRLRDWRETKASKAPGVTQEIWLEYNDNVFKFTSPWNIFLLTSFTEFSARTLKNLWLVIC